jgi:putative ABC transport system permease protein
MEDVAVKKYADKIGADFDELMDTAQPSAIVIDTMKFKDIATDKYVETKLVKTKTGDLLGLDVIDQDTAETVELGQVKVAALTGELPMGVVSQGKIAGFPMIMTRTVFDAFIEGKEDLAYSRLTPPEVYFDSDSPLQLQTELEKVQAEVGASSLYVYNVYNYRDAEEQALLLVSVFTYAFIILITAICIANIINTISTSIALRKREFAMLKSIGITPKGFNRMLNYESIFYGIKALIYGLPISILIIYLMYRTLMIKLSFGFVLPWTSIYIVVAAVFLIVGTAMLYSGSRVRKENIIDALKQEII